MSNPLRKEIIKLAESYRLGYITDHELVREVMDAVIAAAPRMKPNSKNGGFVEGRNDGIGEYITILQDAKTPSSDTKEAI